MSPLVSRASLALAGSALALLYLLLRHVNSRSSRISSPPGPPGWPIIGNLLDAERLLDWRSAPDIRRQWGDITSISVLGQNIMILHTYEKAVELFEKNSLIHSSRPRLNAPGMDDNVAMLPYNSDLRECRRMLRRGINSNTVPTFRSQQLYETKRLLRALRAKPEHFFDLLTWYTGSIILKIDYGYDTEDADHTDPLVKILHEGLEYGLAVTDPGRLLTWFPWLRHIPSWIPGAHFKRTVSEGLVKWERMRNVPFEMALQNRKPSYVTRSYEKLGSARALELFKETAMIFFSAGVDTTDSALGTFFYRMQEYPEIQQKARAELDVVVGHDRLPTFEDRQHLPYINALCKEILRYDPPVRYGLPHKSTADDIHDGYFIPSGTVTYASIWEMSREASHYKDPDVFDPSRFLGVTPELDPASYIFGFGRRICSGMLIADTTLFIAVASILATFEISPPSDGSKAQLEFNPGIINHPKPFECIVKPRDSVRIAALLDEERS